MSAARPFRFCSESALRALQERVAAAFSAWALERLTEGSAPAFEVEVVPCSASPGEVCVPDLAARGAHGTFWTDAQQAASMEILLFGGAARPGSMAADLAQAALAELLEAIADAAPRPCPQEMIDPSQAGRALARARVRCRGQLLVLLVELPEVDPQSAWARASCPPAASYAAALLPSRVSLRATLGDVEVDLGTLHMLRPGDILRLDKRLDECVELDIAGERLQCDAWLVASGRHKALELGRPHTFPPKDLSHA